MVARKLRVISFNVCYAVGRKRLTATVFDAFAALRPDVICLQEVLIGKKRNFARDLAAALGLHLSFSLRAAFGPRQIGLAALTREPAEENNSVVLPRSSPNRPRILQTITFRSKDTQWRIANTHLAVASPKTRHTQLEAVVAALDGQNSTMPTILAGDFNTKTKKEVAVFNGILAAAKFQTPDTLPYGWRFLVITGTGRLDWIATRNCAIQNTGALLDVKGSDHKPVWADVVYPVTKHQTK